MLLLVLAGVSHALAQHPADTLTKGEMFFEEKEKHMGEIILGMQKSHTFTVKNVGTGPLVIKDVKTACSCTVPNWTKTPIAPGKTGTIKVTFDSKGYSGEFAKWITVYATGKIPSTVLFIGGNVILPGPPPTFDNPGDTIPPVKQ